jgi:hypothetical protein
LTREVAGDREEMVGRRFDHGSYGKHGIGKGKCSGGGLTREVGETGEKWSGEGLTTEVTENTELGRGNVREED